MSYDASPTIDVICTFHSIDAWWYITYHRCMVMSYDTSPTIYAWSYHMIHHLPSMHDYVIWYMVMSSPTIDAWSCHIIHHLPSMHGHVISYISYHRCMIMSYDASPTIDVICTFHSIDAWWYVTYHRCIVMSYDTSPTIDAWSYHMIHHLPWMHDYVIWYMVLSSPTIDAWSCHIIHHLPSMHGHVKWNISYHRCMIMSYNASPTIDVICTF
jgi:hypothetical protein